MKKVSFVIFSTSVLLIIASLAPYNVTGSPYINLSEAVYSLYLPAVFNYRPPPPPTITAPILEDIDNPDDENNYIVDWNAVDLAVRYTLEEDTNSSFSSPFTAYSGSSTSREIWQGYGDRYYYRVSATDADGNISEWSNVESTDVDDPTEPVPGDYDGSSPTVTFDVNEDQEACRFYIRVRYDGGTCDLSTSACVDIHNDDFTFSEVEGNSIYEINGSFDTPTTADGSYEIEKCKRVPFTVPLTGNWDAEWVK